MKKVVKIFIIIALILIIGISTGVVFIKNSNKENTAIDIEQVNMKELIFVDAYCVNSWESNNEKYFQYTVQLQNKSDKIIKKCSINFQVSETIEMAQIWNADYEFEDTKLNLYPVNRDFEISNNDKMEFGFIIKSNNELDINNYTIEANNIEEKSNSTEEVIPENKTPVEKYGSLSVKGTQIVSETGETVQLRGVSTHSIQAFPQYVNEETFKELRDKWGVNVIRIAMYSNKDDGYSTSLHETVKKGIDYATNLGLYVIVDWHILKDNNPNLHKTEAIAFFKEIASEYKDNNNILYEICNEPNGKVTWKKDIKPYALDLISEIRQIDSDAIIIVGTPNWSQDVDIVANDQIKDYENIMYTLHFYAASNKEYFREKLKKALKKGLPVFVTEFGISESSGNGKINEEEANKWIELLNEHDISWVCWNLSNKNESSALLNSSCTKLTEFEENDLSQEGKWLLTKLKE